MNLKKILIVCVISGFVLILIGLFFLNKFLNSIKAECTVIEKIEVANYSMIRKECQGFVGPFYYPTILYHNNEKTNGSLIESDSCKFIFAIGKNKMLSLDSCNNTVSEQFPDKKLINSKDVDSAIVFKVSNSIVKKLNDQEIVVFIEKWNNSNPDGAETKGGSFYPNPKYELKIYSNNEIRKFNTSHITITEENSNWSYIVIDENEDRTTQKFDEIFDMK